MSYSVEGDTYEIVSPRMHRIKLQRLGMPLVSAFVGSPPASATSSKSGYCGT
jgi:hypothetical protein